MPRLPITKTPKAYVGGKFIRSESGRVFRLKSKGGDYIANVPRCTRKDTRNAVEAAGKSGAGWASRSAYNRGQILYRLAEMMEARAGELAAAVSITGQVTAKSAEKEVAVAIDRLVHDAGWTDKFEQVLGNTNPVSGPYFNFSVCEPLGVVAVITPEAPALLGLIAQVSPLLAAGNSVVALASSSNPYPAVLLGEMLATSDLPGGVLNLMTGFVDEILDTMASHEAVRGIDFCVSSEDARRASELAADTVKRVKLRSPEDAATWAKSDKSTLYAIRDFIEFKTTWHPVGA